MVRLILAAVAACLFTLPASAGPIEKACLSSGRDATQSLCTCIQQVADVTLTPSDQRRAARFFSDPEEAQKVKLSDTQSSEAFWKRYADFGEAAEMVCAG